MANLKSNSKTTAKSVPAKKQSILKKNIVSFVEQGQFNQRIAEKAYELYQKRGYAHGNDLSDWYEAEKIIASEQK